MPFLSHTTAMPGHLSVAVDARSPGRSVSEAFFQAVGVHNPLDRPARQHLDMDLVKNRGKRGTNEPKVGPRRLRKMKAEVSADCKNTHRKRQ